MVKRGVQVRAIWNGTYDKKMMRGYEICGKGRNEGGSINGYHEKGGWSGLKMKREGRKWSRIRTNTAKKTIHIVFGQSQMMDRMGNRRKG